MYTHLSSLKTDPNSKINSGGGGKAICILISEFLTPVTRSLWFDFIVYTLSPVQWPGSDWGQKFPSHNLLYPPIVNYKDDATTVHFTCENQGCWIKSIYVFGSTFVFCAYTVQTGVKNGTNQHSKTTIFLKNFKAGKQVRIPFWAWICHT